MAEFVFRSSHTLIGCLRLERSWRENFRVDLNENKRGLGKFVGIYWNNTTSWNVSVALYVKVDYL